MKHNLKIISIFMIEDLRPFWKFKPLHDRNSCSKTLQTILFKNPCAFYFEMVSLCFEVFYIKRNRTSSLVINEYSYKSRM